MTYPTYAVVREELVAQLHDAQLGARVPSCPDWTVKDVIAHLSGLVTEKLADTAGSLGSDEATSRQVGDRASMSIDEVLNEWQENMVAFEAFAAIDPDFTSALVADLVVHVLDLDEILALDTTHAAVATPAAAHRYVPRLQARVAERLGIAIDVDLDDGTSWLADADTSDRITLRCSPHDFLRSVTGRRTRAQVEALDWSADPAQILDNAWNQYGTFRSAMR